MTKTLQTAEKIVIAHRGACGYLPEHTLEAKSMAYAMGAHYIEQDVVMTKDNALIVLHDITLDRTTDVADKFPCRARDDDRYYAIDFTLEEIRTLSVTERFRYGQNQKSQEYKNRFPIDASSFRVHTFEEEIQLIQGLNKSTGNNIGIYPEIKQPIFHRGEGKDISTEIVNIIKNYGYKTKQNKVFLQTFSFEELKLLKNEILPKAGIELNLIHLVDSESNYPWMFEEEGMQRLANFADGIGPEKGLIIKNLSTILNLEITPLVCRAHAAGLKVHSYTYRSDPGQVPDYVESFEELLEKHYIDVGVDGVFTDFPDKAVKFLQSI